MLMREKLSWRNVAFLQWNPEEFSLGSKFEVNSTISIPYINKTTCVQKKYVNKTTVILPLIDYGVAGINSLLLIKHAMR